MDDFKTGDLLFLVGSKSNSESHPVPVFILEHKHNVYTYYWLDKPDEVLHLNKKNFEGDFLYHAKDQDKDR